MTDAYLRWLFRGTVPILVGPWLSELGFETLYWIPFLHYLRERYHLPKDRLFPVTRGGAGFWYDAQPGLELFDYLPVRDFRLQHWARHQQAQSVKQTTITPWERTLLPHLASRLGLRRYRVLHPSVMYRTFDGWWHGRMGLASIVECLRFAPMPVQAPPPVTNLPDRFVAVKFYHRPTWPESVDLQQWMEDLVGRIHQKIPVVQLSTGLAADDHQEITIPGTQTLVGCVTPQNNFAVQAGVLTRASAFIGTYGGTMQLAVRLGIPAVGFYSAFKHTAYTHKLLTDYLGVLQNKPVFIGRPQDASFVAQALGGIQG